MFYVYLHWDEKYDKIVINWVLVIAVYIIMFINVFLNRRENNNLKSYSNWKKEFYK